MSEQLRRIALLRRVERWDHITDWLNYSFKGSLLAHFGLAAALLLGADVPWLVIMLGLTSLPVMVAEAVRRVRRWRRNE